MKTILQRIGLLIVFMAMLSLAAGCGTVSRVLVESCTRNEPDLKSYNAVYWKPGSAWTSAKLIVDYSVGDPIYPKQEKRDSSYWAELSIDGLALDEISHPHDGVSIHRRHLNVSRLHGYKQLPIVPIDEVRKRSGRMYVWDYLGQVRAEVEPLIVVESNWMAIQDKSYTRNRGYRRFCPTRSYIPVAQYPKLVGLYPFAILGDIVTFPLVLGFSGWRD